MNGRFLPPEPAGPAPDLGAGPAPAPQQAWQPPAGAQPPASAQQQPQATAQQQPPPPAWQPPPHPPPTWQPTQQQWASRPQPAVPDNGSAVAGFVLSLVSLGLLVVSAGLSSIVSAGCAGFGIFHSLKGRRRVERGETPKHRGLAQAGFIIGIVSVVLAVLATVAWVVVFTTDGFLDDLDRELQKDGGGGGGGFETTVRAGAALVRVLVIVAR